MSELHEVSQAIGRLMANSETQSRQISKLFESIEAVHKCVRDGQSQTDARVYSLELCKASVDNDLKPAIKAVADEVHSIRESILNSKIKALVVLLGVSGGGGSLGAFLTQWMNKGG